MEVAALDAALAQWRDGRAKAARAKARISRSPTTRRYWEARTAPKTFEDKLLACGSQGKACGHCGAPIVRFCNAKLVCQGCSKRSWAKVRKRFIRALTFKQAEAATRWRTSGCQKGMKPRLSLLTCTVRHSGDVRADRRLLSVAWHRWRAWYLQHYQERLQYAWTIEYTPGEDGVGHVHMHVVTLLPFRSFDDFRAAWRRATGDDGNRGVHVNQMESKRKGKGPPSAKAAATYIAKYTTKGISELSIEHGAKWVQAQHGMRSVSTSQGFYVPPPDACECGGEGKCAWCWRQCPSDGGHVFGREWHGVTFWTPSYQRAIPPPAAAGPALPRPTPSGETAGPAPFRGPAQLPLAIA